MLYLNPLSRSCFLVILVALLSGVLPSSAYAQDARLSASVEAAAIADLESGDVSRIMEALKVLPYPYGNSSYKDQISYRTALALIEESERQTDLYFNPPPGYDEDEVPHEFALAFVDYVVALKMPEAIPALLKAAQFGNPPAYALADFGPDIVYTIIEYIDNPERTYKEINGGFFALERTIETHQPLSPSIRSAVKEITVRYLARAEEFYTGPDGSSSALLSAISVARILGDSDLKQMVIDILPLEEQINLLSNDFKLSKVKRTLDNWDTVQQEEVHLND